MPTQPPPEPANPARTLVVDRDNVLQAGKVVSEAVEAAYRKLDEIAVDLVIDSPADDRISTASAAEWNANLVGNDNSHYARLRQYVDHVRDLADQLRDAAEQYGYTDEEIAASFTVRPGQG